MKWLVVLLSIIGIILGICIIAIALFSPNWENFLSHENGYGDAAEVGEGFDSAPIAVSYSPKYTYARELLEEKDIADMGDYLIVVDVSEQKEYIFTNEGELVDVYTVSTGAVEAFIGVEADELNEGYREEEDDADGYEDRSMVKSVWKVVSKRDENLTATYGERLMMLDLLVGDGWIATDVALHGTNQVETLGTPVSLGCVYHENADIIDLYEIIDVGTFVVAVP